MAADMTGLRLIAWQDKAIWYEHIMDVVMAT
jgi:hypothetical protein